jgi:hypothetical protein
MQDVLTGNHTHHPSLLQYRHLVDITFIHPAQYACRIFIRPGCYNLLARHHNFLHRSIIPALSGHPLDIMKCYYPDKPSLITNQKVSSTRQNVVLNEFSQADVR